MKKNIFICLLLISVLIKAQIFNPQPRKITEKFFPDLDVEIETPAFKKNKGFTKYNEMITYLNSLQKHNSSYVSIEYIGKSQKGKNIPLIKIDKNPKKDKVKVWIQAGIHGDEPASTEGILYLIQQLLQNSSENDELLEHLTIGIIPMANIDGFEKQERLASNGLDLNRDQTKLNIPESQILKQAFSDFKAQVALDFHEFNPYRSHYLDMGKAGYTLPYDVMFLYSGNLNIAQSLRNYTEKIFVQNAKNTLEEHQLSYQNYFSTSMTNGNLQFNQGSINPRASATSYALTNCVSTLIEVRGVNLNKVSFKRRVMTTYYIAKSYLETAVEEKERLFKILKESENEVKKITIRTKREESNKTLPFIDIASNNIVNTNVDINNALKSKSIKTRKIPVAYILLPDQKNIAEKLKILGIQMQEIHKPMDLEVDAYKVIDYQKDKIKFEGVNMQTVKTKLESIVKTIPSGSFVIYTDQKNRGILFETLEPETSNSFVSYDVISTGLNQELPIYRYYKSKF